MGIFQKRFIQANEQSELRWIDIANRSGLDKASISQYKMAFTLLNLMLSTV